MEENYESTWKKKEKLSGKLLEGGIEFFGLWLLALWWWWNFLHSSPFEIRHNLHAEHLFGCRCDL